MACSCRTAALRIFVRGFTQLHIADSTPGAVASTIRQRPRAIAVPRVTYRRLHRTAPCRNEAVAAIPEPSGISENTAEQAFETTKTATEQHQEKAEATGDHAALSHSASIAELTPEAIDGLASEITPSIGRPSAQRPDEDQSVPKPRKKGDWEGKPAPEAQSGPRLSRKVRRMLEFGPGDTAPQTDETTDEKKKRRRESVKVKDNKKKDREAAGKKQQARDASEETEVERESWMMQKDALEKKFGDQGWQPRKKLSPDALQGIRALHQQYPDVYSTPVLADRFEMSPEAIRRILKSKWSPSVDEEEDRQQRWFKRGKAIWEQKAEQGAKPPKKWREEGVKTNWAAKREYVKRKMDQRRQDMEEDFPPRRPNDRPRQYRPRPAEDSADQGSRPRRRLNGPRRFGGVGGSGFRGS